MNDRNETDPCEQLRRLVEALDEELPDDEEARATVTALGIDIAAMSARIGARAAAHDAAEDVAPAARTFQRKHASTRRAYLALGAGILAAGAAGALAVVIMLRAPAPPVTTKGWALPSEAQMADTPAPTPAPDAGAPFRKP